MRLTPAAAGPHRQDAAVRERSRSSGQSVVEFALIVPVFMFLLLIALDFGRLFQSYIQLQNAVREAAAYGAAEPTDNTGMFARAVQEKNRQGQAGENPYEPLSITCKNPSGTVISCASASGGAGPGNTMTVTVTERFNFLTPLINGFFSGNLRMSASTTTAVLGSVASPGGGGGPSCSAPSLAKFTITTSGLTVTVNPAGSLPDSGVCAISGYNWSFGDGATDVGSTLPATHTYSATGTYLVTLEVTNQGGSRVATQTVTVPEGASPTCPKPVAGFSFTVENSGKVYFTDRSTTTADCPIQQWLWDFGDGDPKSNALNPMHHYKKGTFSAKLTVTNAGGSHTVTHSVTAP